MLAQALLLLAIAQQPPSPAVDDAKAVITANGSDLINADWPAGVPIVLSADKSVMGDKPNSVLWEIQPASIDRQSQRLENNRTIVLATGTQPKVISVTLTVAKSDTVSKSNVLLNIIPNPDEPPCPDPPKPPVPDPPTPPGPGPAPSNLGAIVMLAAKSPNFKNECVGLAKNYKTVVSYVSQAAAGIPEYQKYKDPAAVNAEIKNRNQIVLQNADKAIWQPVFDGLNKYMTLKQPRTPADMMDALEQIEQAFTAASISSRK